MSDLARFAFGGFIALFAISIYEAAGQSRRERDAAALMGSATVRALEAVADRAGWPYRRLADGSVLVQMPDGSTLSSHDVVAKEDK